MTEALVTAVLVTVLRSALPPLFKKGAQRIARSKAWVLLIPWLSVVLRARNSPERDWAEFAFGWAEEEWDELGLA